MEKHSDQSQEDKTEENILEPIGEIHSTACDHEWSKTGMNGTMTEYSCTKCWAGMQTEDK